MSSLVACLSHEEDWDQIYVAIELNNKLITQIKSCLEMFKKNESLSGIFLQGDRLSSLSQPVEVFRRCFQRKDIPAEGECKIIKSTFDAKNYNVVWGTLSFYVDNGIEISAVLGDDSYRGALIQWDDFYKQLSKISENQPKGLDDENEED